MQFLRFLTVLIFYLNDILRRKIAAIKTLIIVGKSRVGQVASPIIFFSHFVI
jgi:hypothetical protein